MGNLSLGTPLTELELCWRPNQAQVLDLVVWSFFKLIFRFVDVNLNISKSIHLDTNQNVRSLLKFTLTLETHTFKIILNYVPVK